MQKNVHARAREYIKCNIALFSTENCSMIISG